ncbi:hypothetical protein [Flavobacterium sp. HSC-61S13]|uniref:hypothetical protein n=1 Tax=Flavobacterium sp. HSC-61S13 TaxID=2910963 RepID=UPI0020A05FF4|nr:hypothetical protein [Flavobacterium sp. HSC-61S13]MCP1994750.1 hypothetical protein [Flavobacterium sp. HSC-61S13]
MKKYLNSLLLPAIVIATTLSAYAQPGNPNGEPDEPPVPIDDYIPHFIVLAVVIAAFWFYKQSQKKKKPRRSEY